MSALTATVASFLVEQDQQKEADAIEQRLVAVEAKIEELLRQIRRSDTSED